MRQSSLELWSCAPMQPFATRSWQQPAASQIPPLGSLWQLPYTRPPASRPQARCQTSSCPHQLGSSIWQTTLTTAPAGPRAALLPGDIIQCSDHLHLQLQTQSSLARLRAYKFPHALLWLAVHSVLAGWVVLCTSSFHSCTSFGWNCRGNFCLCLPEPEGAATCA